MSLECNIERVDTSVALELAQLEQLCFSKPWKVEQLIPDLERESAYYLIAKNNSAPVGYAGIYISFDEADISRICVSPEYRRCGFAKQLMNAIINYCKQNSILLLHLDVKANNQPAIELYKSFGFCEDCVRKRYYSDGTDAVLMTKKI